MKQKSLQESRNKKMKSILNKNIQTVLELGSSHTGMVVANLENFQNQNNSRNPPSDSNKIQILGAARLSNNGSFKKGIVSNLESLTASILDVIDEVERQTGLEISEAKCVLPCSDAKFESSTNQVDILQNVVTQNDIFKLNQLQQNNDIKNGLRLIQCISSDYHLDNKAGIFNPIGLSAKKLGHNYFAIYYSENELKNIFRSCEQSGLKISSYISEPIAAAEGSLTIDEKEFGCLSISMGAFVTHVSLYCHRIPIFCKEYLIGSQHITKDLAIGLRTTQAEAERIKKEVAIAYDPFLQNNKDTIKVHLLDQNEARIVSLVEAVKIIQPRVKEILEMIFLDLKKQKLLGSLSKGIVLTGGGVQLGGIITLCEKIFSSHARIGFPMNIVGSIEGLKSPMWCANIGAFYSGNQLFNSDFYETQFQQKSKLKNIGAKIWHRMKEPFLS